MTQSNQEGAYASTAAGAGLMAWSHRQRFATAIRLARPHAGSLLLDYGCGDGTLLQSLMEYFPQCVGAEVDPRLAEECARSMRSRLGTAFVVSSDLAAVPDHAFGLIMCTEVLEHCTQETVAAVIAELSRLLAPDGVLVISVPVEIGPVLLVKQLARAAKSMLGRDAAYRERERYHWREFLIMLTASEDTAIPRVEYRQDFSPERPNVFHGHKGFNWKALRRQLADTFVVERTTFSPLAALGPLGSSQAWFTCRPRQ